MPSNTISTQVVYSLLWSSSSGSTVVEADDSVPRAESRFESA